jgi:Flp pilus assembly protein TadG
MIAGAAANPLAGAKGQGLVEFSLVAFLLVVLLFSVVEMGRMVLVYTTVANASRAGARYAIVHGNTRTGTGIDGPSGPGNTAQVQTVVKNFASAGLLSTGRLIVTVTYCAAPYPATCSPTSTSNSPGQNVNVSAVYPYDPLTTYLPLRVRLGSTTQGVIAF